MNSQNNENNEKELQKDSISGPFLEDSDTTRNHFNKPNNFNQFSSHLDDDESSRRIQETLNTHKNNELLKTSQIFPEVAQEQSTESSLESEASEDTDEDEYTVDAEEDDTQIPDLRPKTVPQRVLGFLGLSETITSNPILSYIAFYGVIVVIIALLLFSILLLNNGRGTKGKKEASNYLAYGIINDGAYTQSLTDYLKSNGWCKDKQDCMESMAYQFYKTFRDKIEKKQEEYETSNQENDCNGSLTLNEEQTLLMISTMFYKRSDDDLLSSEKVSNWKFIQYKEEMDYLIEAMYQYDNVCYESSADNYKDAIIGLSGYIDRFRSDLGTNLSIEKKEKIYDAIIHERDEYAGVTSEMKTTIGGYTECSGVTVVDNSGDIIGTYPLEEYVVGVLSGEMYGDFPAESQKALAVAARTYVLASTNSCKKSIESSSRRQNFNEDIKDFAREAVNATAGQVLVDSTGNIFSTEYDSWACKGQNTCTYTKKPTGETHEVTISEKYLSLASGGHGRGMSQIAAADMAYYGKNYQEILLFFYSEGVKIANLTTSSSILSGNRYTSTAPLHMDVNSLLNNNFYNKQAANVGQCVWYARSRAQEILYYSNMPMSMKNIAIDSIKHTYGNGEAWFRNPSGSIFSKSTDVNQPRAGAIVSWSGGLSNCTPNCGHVAIIESVNADGTVTISEGWKTGDWNSTAWSTVRYRKFNATIDYIKYHTNSNGQPYYFNGYVYLLG